MTIKLGQTVTDTLTGFGGVAVALVEFITGCNQVCVQPPLNKDGAWVESRYLDEDRLLVSDQPIVVLKKKTAPGFISPPPMR